MFLKLVVIWKTHIIVSSKSKSCSTIHLSNYFACHMASILFLFCVEVREFRGELGCISGVKNKCESHGQDERQADSNEHQYGHVQRFLAGFSCPDTTV